jgi:prepilin-type N-terminal cleavage/methylation domain-containing protein
VTNSSCLTQVSNSRSIPSRCRHSAQKRYSLGLLRSGFTLIELLIVVTILLLLTTFTVVAVDFTFEAERVRSGARQVQSVLSGARDRAIKAREPRGIRFLLDQDPDNGRMVSSMVYVGAARPWHEGHITLKRFDVDLDGVVDDVDGDGQPDPEVWVIDGSPATLWENLKERGFLGIYEHDLNGNGALDAGEDLNLNGSWDRDTPRIKIPGDKNGTWYRVRTHLLGARPGTPGFDPDNSNRLILTRAYRDPGTTPPDEVVAFEGTGPSTYVLELPPRILPDADPVLLPEGVVIDLDASDVPGFWRPQFDPTPGTITPSDYQMRYSNRMDLMFSPRGTIIGSAAGSGLLHFYICRRIDVELTTELPRAPRYGGGAGSWVPGPELFKSLTDAPPVGDRSLVSVFTSTGKISSPPLYPQDGEIDLNGDGIVDPNEDLNGNGIFDPADNYLDDPFRFAELGEVSSQ